MKIGAKPTGDDFEAVRNGIDCGVVIGGALK
jgi:hypothetical protein